MDTKCKLELSGYTDDLGTLQANEALALSRSQAVADYLIAGGISQKRIRTRGISNSKIHQNNESEKKRALNRKVTFQFVYE
jgi:OmpA-OmpF porin, OOP family